MYYETFDTAEGALPVYSLPVATVEPLPRTCWFVEDVCYYNPEVRLSVIEHEREYWKGLAQQLYRQFATGHAYLLEQHPQLGG